MNRRRVHLQLTEVQRARDHRADGDGARVALVHIGIELLRSVDHDLASAVAQVEDSAARLRVHLVGARLFLLAFLGHHHLFPLTFDGDFVCETRLAAHGCHERLRTWLNLAFSGDEPLRVRRVLAHLRFRRLAIRHRLHLLALQHCENAENDSHEAENGQNPTKNVHL